MSDYSLVYPMLALVLLTFGVAVVLFRARVRSVREGHTPVSYFRVLSGSPEPEFLAQPTRHFINLFEVPTLFYAACLAAMVVEATGTPALLLAWGFVAARLVHAWIHLGANRVRHRFRIYLIGWIFLLALWGYVGIAVALR
jgi:hypothetical protein